ncbi:unnamed protein product [Protopolystoma xenopodis]|uniref:Uncharacterized protein n=1 Tax=Protopolystoma xenopodis TaxID=117903 RepID=A0A3S5CRH3_9PLAT|nr:unnamed protein product [Protopolystoma xenopodis]
MLLTYPKELCLVKEEHAELKARAYLLEKELQATWLCLQHRVSVDHAMRVQLDSLALLALPSDHQSHCLVGETTSTATKRKCRQRCSRKTNDLRTERVDKESNGPLFDSSQPELDGFGLMMAAHETDRHMSNKEAVATTNYVSIRGSGQSCICSDAVQTIPDIERMDERLSKASVLPASYDHTSSSDSGSSAESRRSHDSASSRQQIPHRSSKGDMAALREQVVVSSTLNIFIIEGLILRLIRLPEN